MSDIELRKIQHIELAKSDESQINKEPFANFKLPFKALPEIDLSEVDSSAILFGKKLSQPLIIASMTGGTAHATTINTNLAKACEVTKIAFGVGSMRIALEKSEAEESFKLARKYAPSTVIFANMGAVQLNYGRTIEDYKKIVDMIKADGLYIHINALQEAIQPGGDGNFSGLLNKIENLVKNIKVPIFAKEVGHGLDVETIKSLIEIGIKGIDVAGANGTSWAWIEAKRKASQNLADWFKDVGITTEESLTYAIDCKKHLDSELKIVASGGLRNPVQGLKAILNGANFYSAAKPFLQPALNSAEELEKLIIEFEYGLKVAMFCCGIKNLDFRS